MVRGRRGLKRVARTYLRLGGWCGCRELGRGWLRCRGGTGGRGGDGSRSLPARYVLEELFGCG